MPVLESVRPSLTEVWMHTLHPIW